MKNTKLGILLIAFLLLVFPTLSFSQCGVSDPISTTNYCTNQTAAWSITNSSPSNTSYSWYQYISASASYQKNGTGDSYETAQTFPNGYGTVNTYYYEKEIHQTPTPAIPSPLPAVGGNSINPLSLVYTSTTDFILNYVTVAVHANWSGNTNSFALKVSANGQFSQWFTFKYTDASVVASSGNTFYVKVPVFTSATQLGLNVPAGNSSITISTCSGVDPCPSGAVAIDGGFEYYNPSVLSPTYALGSTMNLNYTASQQNVWGSNSIPGIFNVDVTTKCGKTLVTAIQETDMTKCCTPVSAFSTITSSTGSNIYDTIFPPSVTLTAAGNSSALYYVWYKDGVEMGAAYKGVGKTSIPITTYGIYTVKVVQSAAYVNRAVCYKTTPYEAQKRVLFALANPKTLCLGATGNLVAKGSTGTVQWTTASGVAITNATSQVASITPTAVGKFLFNVQAEVPIGNLVVNGDFEKGNTGFASTYLYKDASTATVPTLAEQYSEEGYPTRKILNLGNGAYTINDYVFWPGWNSWKTCKGRGGVGKFLYTDAATTAGSYIWEQTVNVVAGKTYEFSAWVTNIDSNAIVNPAGNPLPKANIFINGTPLFSPVIPISPAVCTWQKVSQTWTATTSGPITLRVDEISKVNNGNDFAIDDISFGTPGTQTDTVSVTVVSCAALPVSFLFADLIHLPNAIKIIWQTTQESDVFHYQLERSDDNGQTFYAIGNVNPTNQVSLNSYSFIDAKNGEGTIYYRIKEVDFNGEVQYSKILKTINDETSNSILYPNPSKTSFTLRTSGELVNKVVVIATSGQAVMEYNDVSSSQFEFGNDLSPGMYFLEVYSPSAVVRYKIVKQ